MRKKQCDHCPWRVDVVPDRDIPNGYSRDKHCALRKTIAKPGEVRRGPRTMMACHESPVGKERPCVGWAVNQLGPGNNIGLRLAVLSGDERFTDLETVGPQRATFDDTLTKQKTQ